MKLATIILLLPCIMYGQDIKKRKETLGYVKSVEYNVLKSDKQTRHGAYKLSTKDNNKRLAEGQFDNGKMSGQWKFYNHGGKLIMGFNMDKDKPTFLSQSFYKNDSNPIEVDTVAISPEFLYWLGERIGYPYQALRMGVEGKCIFQLSVDENGVISESKVIRSIGANTGKEITEAIDLFEGTFRPAVVDGMPVATTMFLTVHFEFNIDGPAKVRIDLK